MEGFTAWLFPCIQGKSNPMSKNIPVEPDILTITDIVGRDSALEAIKSFTSMDAPRSKPRLLLVGGVSGIGKTFLINQYCARHLTADDCVLRAKYEEGKSRDTRQGILTAIQHCLLASVDDTKLQPSELMRLLEPNYALFAELFPDVDASATNKDTAQVPEASESLNRYIQLVTEILTYLLQKYRKCVLFLDDLHWAGRDSLNLLHVLLLHPDLVNLNIICAYRIEELTISHPVSHVIRQIMKDDVEIMRVDLRPLTRTDVKKLVTTQWRSETDTPSLDLEELYELSFGNPLYLRELLNNLILQGNQTADASPGKNMPPGAYSLHEPRKTVVELVTSRFGRMSESTKSLLKLAACLGARFDSIVLAQLTKRPAADVELELRPALASRLIYRHVGENVAGRFVFAHDRVQESIYSQIDQPQAYHLMIGNSLLAGSAELKSLISTTDVVRHLNAARTLINNPLQRHELCEMNIAEGLRCMKSGSYLSATYYLNIARELLAVDSWTSDYKTAFSVYRNLAESYYLAGDFDQAEQLLHVAMQGAVDVGEKLEIFRLKVVQLTNICEWEKAIDAGIGGLRLVDIDLEDSGGFEQIEPLLQAPDVEDQICALVCSDSQSLAAMSLLNSMVSPIYVQKPQLLRNLVMHQLRITLERGYSRDTAYALEIYAIIVGPARGFYRQAYDLALVGLRINKSLDDKSLRCKIKLSFATNISPWMRPLRDGVEILDSAARDGLTSGDFINSGYCHVSLIMQSFSAGIGLDLLVKEISDRRPFLLRTKCPAIALLHITEDFVARLQGAPPTGTANAASGIPPVDWLQECERTGFKHGVHWFCVTRMLLALVADNYSHVLEYVARSEAALPGAVGQFSVADHNYYHSLILFGMARKGSALDQRHLSIVAENQRQLAIWARYCPDNFLHKFSHVEAERAAFAGDWVRAQEQFKEAISLASAQGFLQDTALALTGYTHVKRSLGDQDAAAALGAQSQEKFRQWGVSRRVDVDAGT